MALTKRQVEKYSSMSLEELCDLIDQYKDDEEELNSKIEELKNQIEEMDSAINELQKQLGGY